MIKYYQAYGTLRLITVLIGQTVLRVLGAIILIVIVNVWLLIPSLAVIFIYLLMCRFYVAPLCNVRRLEAVSKLRCHFLLMLIIFS